MSKNLRDISKQGWTGDGSIENINAGSLQRIADATEIMATNYVQMQRDLDWYKRQYTEHQKTIKRLEHSRAGYKAALTKSRQRVRELKEGQFQVTPSDVADKSVLGNVDR